MVVLDENALGEAPAVIGGTSRPNRRLLQRAQARRGLARVPDPRRRVGGASGLDIAVRRRRDPGEVAEEVEGRSLGGEQRAQWPLDPPDHTAGADTPALVDEPVHL